MTRAAHLAAALALLAAAPAAAEEARHWSYEGEEGPAYWGALDPANAACAQGQQQSPVDLNLETAVDAALSELRLSWTPFAPAITNNGHTVQIDAGGAGGHAMLNGVRYELLQYHFHHASEHSFRGVHAPLEVHLVHRAADGGLLVVGALFREGAENPALAALWPAIPEAHGAGKLDSPVDPAALVPVGGGAFRYQGSLTTPPCSEIVSWVVLMEPVSASAAQIARFAELFPGNARPVQPLRRRFVLY